MREHDFIFPLKCLNIARILRNEGEKELAMEYIWQVIEYGCGSIANENKDNFIIRVLMDLTKPMIDEEDE